jgi:hypothetical protein
MMQPIPISDQFQPQSAIADVMIFDPHMCYPNGMSAPTIDPNSANLPRDQKAAVEAGLSWKNYVTKKMS